jgi:hypothetical protein
MFIERGAQPIALQRSPMSVAKRLQIDRHIAPRWGTLDLLRIDDSRSNAETQPSNS